MQDKLFSCCIFQKLAVHHYKMGSSVLFPASLSRQFCIHVVSLMAVLVFLWLADLQCSDGVPLAHQRGISPAMGPPFNRHLQRKQLRDDKLQIGSRHTTGSYRPGPGSPNVGIATHLRRQMGITRSLRGGHSSKDSAVSNNKTEPPHVEVEALVAFRGALANDPSDALRSWIVGAAAGNDLDTCSAWVGVDCSPQSPYHVVALNLSSLQLEGSLHSLLPTLSQLTFLQSLDLSVNVFGGSIQGELLTNFSHLSYFNLSENVVTGAIPFEIGALVRLQQLDLSRNNMSGPIPETVGNCSLVRSISLGYNFLEGVIPASLGTLSGLEYFDVNTNSLSGSIPATLGNCSSLQYLDLGSNDQIQGLLPQEISLLTKLEEFLLYDVYISGAFPVWIGNLTSLIRFRMGYNILRGEIPETIGQLKVLEWFTVESVPLTGVIPLSISNLTSLVRLEIAYTNISGEIPPQIGMVPNLATILLGYNLLTGVIPSSLANCSSLTSLQIGYELMDPKPIPPWIESLTSLTDLYLEKMSLQGEIPAGIGKLSNLQNFLVGWNNLTGKIPSGFQNCTFLVFFDVTMNSLTGEIPPELGMLEYIQTFCVPANELTGSLPEFIFNWTMLSDFCAEWNNLNGLVADFWKIGQLQQLWIFYVGYNDLEGHIPETIGNCTSMQQLIIPGNQFSGPIPASLGNLTSLVYLSLEQNNFTGRIPVSLLTQCVQLDFLDLGLNTLEGSIPWEIGQLVQLTHLRLYLNKFSGIVPSSLGNCTRMSFLDFSENQFVGSIPAAAISNMSASLTSLTLAQNLFSGSWPKEFAELTSVQDLDVSSNNISGPILIGLGQCLNLVSLDISLNNLTGQIPQDIGSLVHLEFFNASFNDFTGPIPQSGIFNSSWINESSFLGNPSLCGPSAIVGLHHLECAAIPPNASTHDQHDRRHCKGFACNQIWIPIAVVSTVIVLGAVWAIVAISSGWIFQKNDDPRTPVLLNFGGHLQLTKRDVFQAMDDVGGDNVIGVGARSIVYKGTLEGGQMFALKKLLPQKQSDSHHVDNGDLLTEAKLLAKLRHKNIVKCLSFYSDMDHKALVLEYMCGGCLHKHLHEVEPCKLMWQTRLKVAMGVAEGMKYLHHDFPEAIIHRDLKPSNIFLDADFEPTVGDFGISKFVSAEREGAATASTFCGTVGYMPPEYASQVWVSTKGDVYSYGMVIIELLTRRQPQSTSFLEDQGKDLRSWVLDYFHEKPSEVLDPLLIKECNLDIVGKEQMMLLLRLSLFCTRADPTSRPSMMDVVGMLTSIINLGKEALIRRSVEELANDMPDPNMWVSQDPAFEGAEFGSNC